MLGPPGSCAQGPLQEQHTHARLEGPFKSVRLMHTGGKGPAETRLPAEAQASRQTWSSLPCIVWEPVPRTSLTSRFPVRVPLICGSAQGSVSE